MFQPIRYGKTEFLSLVEKLRREHPELDEKLVLEMADVVGNPQIAASEAATQAIQSSTGPAADLARFPEGFIPCWRNIGTCSKKPPQDCVFSGMARKLMYHPVGTLNQYHYLYLCEHITRHGGYQLSVVPGDGECMYSALRRQFQCFSQWSNHMFRRAIGMFMLQNWDWVFPLLKDRIRDTHGAGDSSVHNPGPFSFLDFVMFTSHLGNWGDWVVLYVVSLMMGVKITVLLVPGLTEERIRHDDPLEAVHFILCFHENHYTGVSEYTFFCILHFPDRCSTTGVLMECVGV